MSLRPTLRACAALASALLVMLLTPLLSSARVGIRAARPASANFGVNFSGGPLDLALAGSAGVGLARTEVLQGADTDTLVASLAAAHLRLLPMLGLPCPPDHPSCPESWSPDPQTAITAMAGYISDFARRYGPGGSFWRQNPTLPYLPVLDYEVGNEPDITPSDPADAVHLHYQDPTVYARVYDAARSALHTVNPRLTAVVGGMLDSGVVTLGDAERYLGAIAKADAIAFHPYEEYESQMKADTLALRAWLNRHGFAGAPLEIDEYGGAAGVLSETQWAATEADYSGWAMCAPALDVSVVAPFWWGSTAGTDSDSWYAMSSSAGALTDFGQRYLAKVRTLEHGGCGTVAAPARAGHRVSQTAGGAGRRSRPAPHRQTDSRV